MSALTLNPLRLLIADDDPLLLEHMTRHLSAEPDITVVGTATTGVGALGVALAAEALKRPDIALLDVDMPEMDGVETARRLKELLPDVLVVMYTAFEVPSTLDAALAAGAKGFVTKDTPPAEIATVLRKVATGAMVMDSRPAARALEEFQRGLLRSEDDPVFAAAVAELSEARREIFNLMTTGASNAEITRMTGLSASTVKDYTHRVLKLTGCETRTKLVVRAAKAGLTWDSGR